MEWEYLDDYVSRSKIFGGWLVRIENDVCHNLLDRGLESGWDYRPALTFVPDAKHEWKIEPKGK